MSECDIALMDFVWRSWRREWRLDGKVL